jgi:hypothetical protein
MADRPLPPGDDGILSEEDEAILDQVWDKIQREGWESIGAKPPSPDDPPPHFSGGDGRWTGGPLGSDSPTPFPATQPPSAAVLAQARILFARNVSPAELARLGGCTPDGSASFSVPSADVLQIDVTGPGLQLRHEVHPGPLLKTTFVFLTAPGRNHRTRTLAVSIAAGQRQGLRSLHLQAQGSLEDPRQNGYFDLPRLGFDGALPPDLPEAFSKAHTVLDLLHLPGGLAYWKEHGEPFDAVFDLSGGSRSLQIFNDYLIERQRRGFAGFGEEDVSFQVPLTPAPPQLPTLPAPPLPQPHLAQLDWDEEDLLRRVWQRRNPQGYEESSADALPPAVTRLQTLFFLLDDGIVTPSLFQDLFLLDLQDILAEFSSDSVRAFFFDRVHFLSLPDNPLWCYLALQVAQRAVFQEDTLATMTQEPLAADSDLAASVAFLTTTAKALDLADLSFHGSWVALGKEALLLPLLNPVSFAQQQFQDAAQKHLAQKPKPQQPSPIRRDPAGTPRTTQVHAEVHDQHPGATNRSRGLVKAIRHVVSKGPFHEKHLKSIAHAVGALTDDEAQHVHRALTHGGHKPDDARDAAAKVVQALHNHRHFQPRQDPEDQKVQQRLKSYSLGDQHLQGLLRFATQHKPDTSHLRSQWAQTQKQSRHLLDQLLQRPPTLAPEQPADLQHLAQQQHTLTEHLRQAHTLQQQIADFNDKARSLLTDMLKTATPVTFTFDFAAGVSPPQRAACERAQNFLQKVFHLLPGQTGNPVIEVTLTQDRPYYERDPEKPGWGRIALTTNSTDFVALHFLAHALEDNIPGLRPLLQSFRSYRCRKQPLQDLGEFNLALSREEGCKDKFDTVFDLQDAYYVGRTYARDPTRTEILAMGWQQLYRDPLGLARQDPEYTKLLLGILKGDLRA